MPGSLETSQLRAPTRCSAPEESRRTRKTRRRTATSFCFANRGDTEDSVDAAAAGASRSRPASPPLRVRFVPRLRSC